VNSPLQQLLETKLPFPGLAAWAARLPDGAVGRESFVNWFTPEQLEQLIARLAQGAENLARHQLAPRRLCWVFEHARVQVAMRPEGACLALFLENRPGLPAGAVREVLEDFLTLQTL
jgi:hypothetical protein